MDFFFFFFFFSLSFPFPLSWTGPPGAGERRMDPLLRATEPPRTVCPKTQWRPNCLSINPDVSWRGGGCCEAGHYQDSKARIACLQRYCCGGADQVPGQILHCYFCGDILSGTEQERDNSVKAEPSTYSFLDFLIEKEKPNFLFKKKKKKT